MSAAVAGLIGVAVGAIISGAIQWAVAQADRRIAARTAARLLRTAITRADADLVHFAERREWTGPATSPFLRKAWTDNAAPLARGLTGGDFALVSQWVELALAEFEAGDKKFDSGKPAISEGHRRHLLWIHSWTDQVRDILEKASRGRREPDPPPLPPPHPDFGP